ncbi:AGE family epimerase/isomerase [Brevundimonas sp. AJA228-03]|uniref:AGE family epimerase/isomerase n=1 Tax=Brevundimonas sp. AJA228-03 TaxID=2752515 RepID=UPI001ADFB524|nr:AGE family epimerase/isomerase [Brevundimonas sp. AJA228-03]QTN19939.1 AGE family epimerase/isomerase [Brevundimonas sp. AJA228-03]
MALYPVIMCGGAGTRLWPASRPSRPKQFIPLAGNRSLFQDTAQRVAPLADHGGRLVIIGGVAHRDTILDQLAEIGLSADILLEPQPRDSAAAMAAAAAWVSRRDPEGVTAFVASDHYVPDAKAFRQAVLEAAERASDGHMVTLGVKPSEASAAYGYIKPAGPGLARVDRFCEKPDAATAAIYIDEGYLWNSGNFIVQASTLMAELKAYAPAVEAAATAALPVPGISLTHTLSDAFLKAPKISIDYAVMEKTRLAWVLAVDFAWSDLGAWDSIAASGEGNRGIHIFEDSEHCLARAPDGVLVAALGVQDLAIIVEPDAVLVCSLSRSQDVKRIVERIRATSARHLDFEPSHPETLADGARRFADWLRLKALPTWATLGMGCDGSFAEALTLAGRPVHVPRRARVQARQIYVYAQAGILGWEGPWQHIVKAGTRCLIDKFIKPDGLARTLLSAEGEPLDDTSMLYDQAFILLALAMADKVGVAEPDLVQCAINLRDALAVRVLPNGALREAGEHPFQSNAHMHLLEAALEWEQSRPDAGWMALSDRVVGLALSTFIDPAGGFLREFFDESWGPADGDDGRLVEPGHQFEWAWLLARYAVSRKDEKILAAAHRLYAAGLRGVGDRDRVACDSLNDDLSVRSSRARLWPQTEWLKASLILAECAVDGSRADFLEQAAAAQRALALYLTSDGLWHDKRLSTGAFIDEPAPASSFYHIMAAFTELKRTEQAAQAVGPDHLSLA